MVPAGGLLFVADPDFPGIAEVDFLFSSFIWRGLVPSLSLQNLPLRAGVFLAALFRPSRLWKL